MAMDTMMLARRRLLAAAAGAAWLAVGGPAWAQADWSRVAVPAYSPADILRGLHRFWTVPRAQAFTDRAQSLVQSLGALAQGQGGLPAARAAWAEAMLAWERLSAVSLGPLIERRSARQIDFAPTRPALIERAIQAQPRGPAAMESIGTPAQGLPALEWLLWTRPLAQDPAAHGYAIEVAGAVLREAQALLAGLQRLAERDTGASEEVAGEAIAGLGEFVNQWVGGLERLRWAHMEKPLRAGRAELPRAASGRTVDSWMAQWEALRTLAVFDAASGGVPAPGEGLVPLETCLRARGLNLLADKLARQAGRVSDSLRNLPRTPTLARLGGATRAMAALKTLAEAELASSLDVSLGFSDADGD